MSASRRDELAVVLEAVREAGELLRVEARRPGGPRGGGSHADVDDEMCALLVDQLGAAFPEDRVLSEELPERPGSSGRAFVIDPHDGTRHFLRGSRDTSVSVGLVEGDRLTLGVVYAPLATPLTGPDGLLAAWALDEPLTRNGQEVRAAAPEPSLTAESTILVSPRLRPRVRAWNEQVFAPARLVGCGSIATRLALVAVGEASGGITLRTPLEPWDYAGGQALLRAASGALVGPDGERVSWVDGRPAIRGIRDFFAARSHALAREMADRWCGRPTR